MKLRWVKQKEKERLEQLAALTAEIRQKLTDFGKFSDAEIDIFMAHADRLMEIGLSDAYLMIPHENTDLNVRMCNEKGLLHDVHALLETLPYQKRYFTYRENYFRFLDSEPKHFHGDIIITDPCYVLPDEIWENTQFFDDGHIETPDMPNLIGRDTIYGDWSCTVFGLPAHNVMGHFCADSGQVAVLPLEDALKCNPKFNYHITKEWTTTLIKNFDGDVWFHIKHYPKYDDYSVEVVGNGKDFTTGDLCQFISKQTGL